MSKASNISEINTAIKHQPREPSTRRGLGTGKSTGAGRKNANSNISSATEKSLNTTSNSVMGLEEQEVHNLENDANHLKITNS